MKRGWPLRAWVAVCALGGVLGFFVAIVGAGISFQIGPILLQILPHPSLYWPYPTFGLVIAALTFYLAGVLRNSN
jgi:hypothetical protein